MFKQKRNERNKTRTKTCNKNKLCEICFLLIFSIHSSILKITPLKIYKKKLYEDGIFNYQKLSVSIWKELSNLYQNFNTVEICKYAKVLWGVKTNGVFSRGWGYKTSRVGVLLMLINWVHFFQLVIFPCWFSKLLFC